MSAEKLALRYAKALFSEATSTGSTDAIYADMELIRATLKASRDLKAMFKSPVIQTHKKLVITSQVFGGKINAVTEQFLQMLISQSREAFLPEVIKAFFKLYNESKGITEVTVTTATELDAENEQKIEKFIKSQSGFPNIRIHKKTDPSIIGGFIVDFGGKLYDNSIRYKLNKVTKELSLN
jgi:F-type H+-transporting ATPase subunit delta